MKNLTILIMLVIFVFTNTYANKEQNIHLKKLLTIIQGSFNDKIYTITIKKSKEYLKLAPKDDKYREKVLNILFYSLLKTNNKTQLKKFLSDLEKEQIPKKTKTYFYLSMLKNFQNDENLKTDLLIKLYNLTKDEKYIQSVAISLYKNKKWEEILKLPDNKSTNLYKVIALFKLGKYKQVIDFTNKMAKFNQKHKDDILYYRGLAFIKLNKKEKGIKTLEAITFKTPKIIEYLANYYLKTKNYIYAERYLKLLALESKYKDYAIFYLAYIYEQTKDYENALKFYKKLLNKDNKYSKLAFQRILILKSKNLVPKEDFYSIRVVLYKKQKTAEKYIKSKKLSECYVYPYKNFYGVYCGIFYDKNDAKKFLKTLKKKLKIKDIVIQKINL